MIALVAAIVLGAIVQGSIGFGFAFVSVPIFLIVRPEAVPVAILTLAVPLTIVMFLREHDSIDMKSCAELTSGRIVGTSIGVWLLSVVPPRLTGLLLGLIVVIAVLLNVGGRLLRVFSTLKVMAGVVSGIAGTTTALGGGPTALAVQDKTPSQIRSTLGLTLLFGNVVSLGGLAIAQRIHGSQLILAAKLLPALVLGTLLSGLFVRVLRPAQLRAGLLMLAGLGGMASIAKNWP